MKKGKNKTKAKPKTKAKKAVKSKAKPKRRAKAKAKPVRRRASATSGGGEKELGPRPGIVAPKGSALVGFVDDYFAKIGVIALTLKAPLSVGATIHLLGHTTNFEQTIDSMQIEHQPVTDAKIGDGIGIKVTTRARRGDHVYLIP